MFKTVELGEVLNYEQPTRFIVESDIYNDEFDTPVLTAGKSFILGYTNEEENIYQNYPVIIFDDFTTATKYVDFPFKVKSSAMKILSCDENIADIKFLFYLIQTIRINSEQHQRYWISKFSKIKIPLPPLETQKAITEKLDKADALRKKDQELLQKYDDLAQSIFIDMFGDPIKNEKGWEKDFCENIFNINLGKMLSASNYKGDALKPYLRNVNIQWDGVNFEDIKYMDFYPNEYDRFKLKKGDILVCEGGEVGRTTIYNSNDEFFIQNALHRVRIKENNRINAFYFVNLMKNGVPRGLLDGYVNGAGIKHFTLINFKRLKIILPPINLQNQFAEKIKNIEAQKALVKQQAQQSEDLFQALLQQSFTF